MPLKRERHDVVVRTEQLDRPAVRTMLDILRSETFRAAFDGIGGHDLADMGRILHET